SSDFPEDAADAAVNFDIDSPKIKDRLGEDNGYAFAIMYAGDTHGSLENCGCPSHPMGGLAWGVSYVKAFRQRSNYEAPALMVDAGNMFTDNRFVGNQLPAEAMIKNQWVLKAYGEFRYDVANISFNDLPYMAELLKKEGYDKRVEDYPFINRLVSANVQPTDDSRKAPLPYIVREVTLNRAVPGKKLRIAFVGLTEGKPIMANQREPFYAGFRIDDVFETAKRIIPEAKQKADLVVVLAYMPQDMTERLASENPDIDTIIGARQVSQTNEPQHFGRATVTYVFNQTKYLGELRYYMRGDGTIENQVNRYVGLDADIPEDPQAAEIVAAAHTEFTNVQRAEMNSNPQPPPMQNISSDSPYVGAATCASCHSEQYSIWEKSGHAHAMATLEKKNQQFDNDCVRCHVVGFEKGGFQTLITTPQLANVQCEACHGPGRAHIAAPAKGYGVMATPAGCMQCHTQSNSPDFNFEAYWPKIKH
ncbi:MAG TPA: multiheme c-type cytochrome, partial [Blastocatellia bacterium]|nr:multiheme c-type cytochrome [Blastocatellia bacterium]